MYIYAHVYYWCVGFQRDGLSMIFSLDIWGPLPVHLNFVQFIFSFLVGVQSVGDDFFE